MKAKLLKALWALIRNAPAIIEAVKASRERHPAMHTEPMK